MLTLREKDEKTAAKKGLWAGAALVGSISLGIVASPFLAAIALVPTAYLAYDWFMFRAKRGMRV